MQIVLARLGNWARSRRGVVALVLSLAAAIADGRWRTASESPIAFIVALPVAWFVVAVLATTWDRNTWPDTPPWARPRTASTARQLREDANARMLQDHGGFLFERRYFFVATGLPPVRLSREFYEGAERDRAGAPVLLAEAEARRWWWYGDTFCWENCGYGARDVQALLHDRERKRQRQLERAHLLLNLADADAQPRREPVPREVRRTVFDRDGGRCVECGSNFDLQYDHVIPVALGGATSVENLQLLCLDCNVMKGADI